MERYESPLRRWVHQPLTRLEMGSRIMSRIISFVYPQKRRQFFRRDLYRHLDPNMLNRPGVVQPWRDEYRAKGSVTPELRARLDIKKECEKRAARREVLFAKGRGGSNPGPRVRKESSDIRC